ncbi:sugar O-acetyltransferase [Aerococcus viridans]|uniref:Acetyltransferase n=1 Tax=Aerococcus viridans TaxID=1377 RepID=A0A2J9PN44_9LACT|nr:sugar O-acetyltransferase [Aerococcus viridans]MCT1797758.1 sugar O-acetyltransferase [Aerococcus viridans]PNL91737.1 maltose acetyltransferase [Aerococcus viridans]
MTSEKDKMLAGKIYDANYDQELVAARVYAKELCYDFNHARPSEEAKRQGIIRQLLGKTGNQFEITGPFYCDYGFNIEIGENFYANHNLVILDGAKVTFGDNVFVAPDCGFYTAGHPLDADRRNKGLEYAKPITVGNNVWFGGGVKVMPGVTIGDGAVIGGGSVVTKDIPTNMIAVGNPCKPIREITEADARCDG